MHALPDDYNRVVLEEIPGVQGSDYINASFIDVIISCTAILLVTACGNLLHLSGIQEEEGIHCSSG